MPIKGGELLLGLLLGLALGLQLGLMLKLSLGTPGCTNHAPVLRPMAFWNTATKITLYMYISSHVRMAHCHLMKLSRVIIFEVR